ncbi:MAG: hypothetical protein A2252_00775 [Elusimicrobia bacterium RIFOXYA2_FULL_39_19]|nr:MAG: hypothetical protein A2252_00775 [Elusimicrobia bacterium RIFOXYA2_FULL_39_19]
MSYIDCHVHSMGDETFELMLEWMDREKLNKHLLFSKHPFMSDIDLSKKKLTGLNTLVSDKEFEKNMAAVGEAAAKSKGRIVPFLWIEPTMKNTIKFIETAVKDYGYKGIKIIPNGWYPGEERFEPVYDKIAEMGLPILFHTGALWSFGETSKYCRPLNFEFMMKYPGTRFAMAHIGWPWIDECVAVALKFIELRENFPGGDKLQCYVDITPGTPPFYREYALKACLDVLGPACLMFGTDSRTSTKVISVSKPSEKYENDKKILTKLGCSQENQDKIFHKNFLEFVGE